MEYVYKSEELEKMRNEVHDKIINLLSENHFSLHSTKSLFNRIIEELEWGMPISTDIIKCSNPHL